MTLPHREILELISRLHQTKTNGSSAIPVVKQGRDTGQAAAVEQDGTSGGAAARRNAPPPRRNSGGTAWRPNHTATVLLFGILGRSRWPRPTMAGLDATALGTGWATGGWS